MEKITIFVDQFLPLFEKFIFSFQCKKNCLRYEKDMQKNRHTEVQIDIRQTDRQKDRQTYGSADRQTTNFF